jgi:DNA-binding transcriptional regulator YdaS (Cro superfamily)
MKSPLTKYRQDKALTLEIFGEMFCANKSTVLRWEAGRIPAERVLEIERVTGIPRQKLRPDLYPVERAA